MSKTSDIATIAVVALIGAGGFLIYKNRNEIGNFFGGIGTGVQNFTDGIGKGVGDFTDSVGKWYGDTVEGIQKGVDDAGKGVGNFFGGIVSDIGSSYANLIGGLQNTVTGIQKGVDDFASGAGDFFGGIAEGAGNLVDGVGNFFGGLFNREDEGATMTPAPIEPTPEPVPEPVPVTTVLQNGKIVEKDAKIKMIESTSGIQVKEVIGAPSTLTKEERAKLPTKTTSERAQGTSFLSRAFAYAKSKL
jgi:hypothetical protein